MGGLLSPQLRKNSGLGVPTPESLPCGVYIVLHLRAFASHLRSLLLAL
jgi:hypothetical protein